jgi:hypothetical protein
VTDMKSVAHARPQGRVQRCVAPAAWDGAIRSLHARRLGCAAPVYPSLDSAERAGAGRGSQNWTRSGPNKAQDCCERRLRPPQYEHHNTARAHSTTCFRAAPHGVKLFEHSNDLVTKACCRYNRPGRQWWGRLVEAEQKRRANDGDGGHCHSGAYRQELGEIRSNERKNTPTT